MSDNRGGKYAVFEAANGELQELYVTWTALSIFNAMADFCMSPPIEVSHWAPKRQHIHFRSLEFELSVEDARAFVAQRLAAPPPEDWNYVPNASLKGPAQSKQPRGGASSAPFVLLVEDRPDDIELTMLAFNSNDFPYKVEIARDGAAALAFLRDRNADKLPALVLVDLNMPKVNGFEFLQRLRRDPRLSGLPVSILTSSKQDADRVQALKLGASDYILKPLDLSEADEVVGRIKRLLPASIAEVTNKR